MTLSQLNLPARGCRGGRHKKRSIATTVRNRIPKCIARKTASGVNIQNLVQVPRSAEQNTHNASEIRFATWNAWAIRAKNKSASLCDYIISNQLDILAVTETWLTGSDKDNRVIADIKNTLPNYEIHHVNRTFRKGGDFIAVIARDGLKVTLNTTCDFNSMEYIDSAYLFRFYWVPTFAYLPTATRFQEETYISSVLWRVFDTPWVSLCC